MLGLTFTFSACDDWTDTEIKDPTNLTDANKSEAYYQALREWKQTDHQITFGWFGNWVGEGTSQEHSLRGLPDSVDMVSIWGNCFNLTEARKADLKYAQTVRGLKVLMCWIVDNYGVQLTPGDVDDRAAFWGEDNPDPNGHIDSIRIDNYAKAICDTIRKYNYDGFDWDYEPNYGHSGNISSDPWAENIFAKALRRELGDYAETGKILAIDGQPQTVVAQAGPLFDYFIVQAYACSSYTNLDNRINATITHYDGIMEPAEVAKRYVITENFESYASNGGVSHTTRDGYSIPSLEGMARFQPIYNGQTLTKGGVGTYHMEYEYKISGRNETYPYLRQAIQIMNPSNIK